MADDFDPRDNLYPGDASGHLHPDLITFRRQFANEDGAAWSRQVADKIQTYLTSRAIQVGAQQRADALVENAHQAQTNLTSIVRSDPHAVDLALDLASDAAVAIGAHHPPGEDRNQAVADLTGQFRNQVAHAAVQSMAGASPTAARQLLDRMGEHLTVGDVSSLSSYIDNMEHVQLSDQRAQAIATARAAVERNNTLTSGYLNGLLDDNANLTFPAGWGSRVMQDERLAPEARGALYGAYNRLQTNGDVPSNPATVADLLERATIPYDQPGHPMPHEVIGHVGSDLSARDASFINQRLGPQGASTMNETQALTDAIGDARNWIGSGPGSGVAFGRFLDWLLPTYQRYTAAGMPGSDLLHPESQSYLMTDEKMAQFRPSGDDIVQAVGQPAADRPSLGQIFAAAAPVAPVPRAIPVPGTTPPTPEPGTQFRDLLEKGGGAPIPLQG